ncbi:MAG: hypothetical protein WDW36_004400 [Sanguina aurantia]
MMQHPRHQQKRQQHSWQTLSVVTALQHGAWIAANISSLTVNKQPVRVTFAGVAKPTPDDHIALYVPGDVDVQHTVPIQFLNITLLCGQSYLDTGTGDVMLQLLNMRGSMSFKITVGGIVSPVVIATSAIIPNLISRQPTSGHLALHQDSRSVVVQWVSGSPDPQDVEFSKTSSAPGSGTSSRAFRSLAAGSSQHGLLSAGLASAEAGTLSVSSRVSSYARRDMCGFPANSTGWLDPGFLHTAVLNASKLPPNTQFRYKYGSEADGWSASHNFTSPPPIGWTGTFKFLVFNDVCQGSNTMFFNPEGSPFYKPGQELSFAPYGKNSVKLPAALVAAESDAQLALLIGDLAYALGYGADWDVFGQQFEEAFTMWPLLTGVGNHERDFPNTGDAFNNSSTDSGGECNIPHFHRYYSPAHTMYNDPRKSYYSFDMGSVHFVILDGETPSEQGSDQGRWAAADLSAVDRSLTPWVIVGIHRMMYAPATFRKALVGDLDVMQRLQADYEELFKATQVDMVVSGHEHAYARTCKVYKHQCVAQAPVYMLAGHAGAGFTHGFPKSRMPSWVMAGIENANGYLRYTVNATSLLTEAISSDDGRVMDFLLLTKTRT